MVAKVWSGVVRLEPSPDRYTEYYGQEFPPYSGFHMSVQHESTVMALLQQYSPLFSVLATMPPNTGQLSNLNTHLKTAVRLKVGLPMSCIFSKI
jgi:hypothetical protein